MIIRSNIKLQVMILDKNLGTNFSMNQTQTDIQMLKVGTLQLNQKRSSVTKE